MAVVGMMCVSVTQFHYFCIHRVTSRHLLRLKHHYKAGERSKKELVQLSRTHKLLLLFLIIYYSVNSVCIMSLLTTHCLFVRLVSDQFKAWIKRRFLCLTNDAYSSSISITESNPLRNIPRQTTGRIGSARSQKFGWRANIGEYMFDEYRSSTIIR